jgi:hypothetical protein
MVDPRRRRRPLTRPMVDVPGRESLCNAAARSVPLSWKTASRWRQRSDNQGRTARRSLPELAVVLVWGHVGQLGL